MAEAERAILATIAWRTQHAQILADTVRLCVVYMCMQEGGGGREKGGGYETKKMQLDMHTH